MASYLQNISSARQTPQREKIPGSSQVPNSEGGFVWKIAPLRRLARWLVLGSEGGSFYAGERKLTQENVACLTECDPYEAIDLIVEISDAGRAPKNDPALYALAYYAGKGHPRPTAEDIKVRQYALDRLAKVARIGTHLFHFLEFVEKQRGWGRSLRRAVAEWYKREDVYNLAYQAVKYRQRDAWTHRDLLRLAHPSAPTPEHAALYDWIAHPDKYGVNEFPSIRVVEGFIKAQAAKGPKETARLIGEYNLPREALNTDHLKSPDVWEALLYAGNGMPLGALIRNIPTMTRVGLIGPMSQHIAEVTRRVTDAEGLKKARVHPLQLLVAHLTYQQGQSVRGNATWQPIPQVVDALDAGFYAAFGAVEPTGKRILLALDVSSSMDGSWGGWVNGVPGLTPRIASAAMALVTAAVEPNHYFMAFSHELVPIEISPRERLDAVVRKMQKIPFGGTNCALPMLWASGARVQTTSGPRWVGGRYAQESQVFEGEKTVPVDAFIVYTDNETYADPHFHPSQALTYYREKTGIDARSVVVGLVANAFSIADPQDPGMLDCVGMDTSTPQIISDFIGGKI